VTAFHRQLAPTVDHPQLPERVRIAKCASRSRAYWYTGDMPNVVILAGPNGAGKSTSAPAVVAELLAAGAFVNADVIARGLSGFDPDSVAFQAGRIMLQRLEELAAQRADFAFETTLASRSFAPFVRQLRDGGYRTRLVYVWVESADLCIRRVHARYEAGGHFVAEDIVRRRYERSLLNFFSLYRPLADEWQVYDNSSGERPVLVAEGHSTQAAVIHERAVWDEMMRRVGQ
jgi:predicted ABC-type ATPase